MDIQKDNVPESKNNTHTVGYNSTLFHDDEKVYYFYKKIEAIVSAVFLITDLIEDKNALLKDELRKQALKCLTDIHAVIGMTRLNVNDFSFISSSLLHLNSLITAAFWSGILSEMNASIIQKEIVHAYSMVTDIVEKYKNKFTINPSLFAQDPIPHIPDKNPEFKRHDDIQRQQQLYKGQYKRQSIKDNIKDIVTASGQKNNVSESKTERREKILKLLHEKNNLSVKDFATVISGYSEKTIQRELLSLVEEGLLIKEGERRWSTYSLAV